MGFFSLGPTFVWTKLTDNDPNPSQGMHFLSRHAAVLMT
ncbi:hypothetical protein EOK76_g0834 [Lacticaseibacillus paracasei]|nr:hypothetical protein EOK76_g0834 [Lacticaseibacillus paracasei]